MGEHDGLLEYCTRTLATQGYVGRGRGGGLEPGLDISRWHHGCAHSVLLSSIQDWFNWSVPTSIIEGTAVLSYAARG